MADKGKLSGRARRYAKVGTAVGGLAARLATDRVLGRELDRGTHAAELRAVLGGLKGPLMKLAQILSTIPNALPMEYADQLAELQANAPPMGWNFVKRRMATELGADWSDKFAEFGHTAAAAASLGQVHRARTGNGRRLACKLQYPDMGSVIEADLAQLKLAFAIYRRFDKAIDPRQVHAELAARLREELDYEREARHMKLYGRMLKGEPGVHVPTVVERLSTDRLLVMSWLDGAPLIDFKDRDQAARDQVAHNMFRAWYVPFYRYGIIHGDPHLGNYTVRPDLSINLLDFGCIRVFPPSFVKGVIDLYKALRDGNPDLAQQAYESWGFERLDADLISVLNLWAEFVYAPLLEDRDRRIQENQGNYGAEVAHKVRAELHRLGGVTPPPEFVLMDRAAIGLGSVFTHLRAEINWHRMFHDLIDDFDGKALARRQKAALAAFALD